LYRARKLAVVVNGAVIGLACGTRLECDSSGTMFAQVRAMLERAMLEVLRYLDP
jgi:hypothetical protein